MLAGPIPLNTKRFSIGSDDQFTGVGVGEGDGVGLGLAEAVCEGLVLGEALGVCGRDGS